MNQTLVKLNTNQRRILGSALLNIMYRTNEELLDQKIKNELSRLDNIRYISLMDVVLSEKDVEVAKENTRDFADFFCDKKNLKESTKWLSKKYQSRKNFYFTNCIRQQSPGMFGQGSGVYHLCEAFALLSDDSSVIIYYRTVKRY